MRIDWDGRASPLTPRDWSVDRAVRHSQPETPFDQQPASSAPGGSGDVVSATFGSALTACRAVLPKLNNTLSNERFCKMRVHEILL